MLHRRFLLALFIAASCQVVSLTARAEPTAGERATAEALFRDARTLMNKKDYAKACRKLEESQRLDPQGGTLLNLAVCHAREGRTASAWVELQEAAEIARNAKRRDRVRLAEKELKQIEGKLSRLTIEVPDQARLPGLEIHRGMETLGEGTWGTAIPVDPDTELALEAGASGYRPWKLTVTLKPAEQKTVVIPRLEKLPPPPKKPHRASAAELRAEEEKKERETLRTVAYIAGGVGIVGVGVGSYFGLRAMSKESESEDHCDGSLCDPEGLDLSEQADRAATISNVAFGTGLVGLGVGTYLFLISQPPAEKRPAGDSASSRLSVVPSIAPGSGSILMSGRW